MSAGGCLVTLKYLLRFLIISTRLISLMHASTLYDNAYRIVGTAVKNQSLKTILPTMHLLPLIALSSCYNYNLLTNFALHPSHNSVVENHQLDLSLLAFEDIQSNMVTDELKFTPIICSHIPSSWTKIFLRSPMPSIYIHGLLGSATCLYQGISVF